VSFDDVVFTIGRVALLVAALAAGDVDALAAATQDRLHQDGRLAARPESRDALERGRAAGAWCGWLSGSGPTIALLCPLDTTDVVGAALPDTGSVKVLRIDHEGAVVERPALT
jgi:homoserine kinase